jgi:hypothetical protein
MEQLTPQSSNRGVIITIVVVLCCICTIALALGGYAYYYVLRNIPDLPVPSVPSNHGRTEQPPVTVTRPPVESVPTETMDILGETLVPENDPYEMACRLKEICNVSKTLPAPSIPYKVGDKQKFWLLNSDTNENFQINATLLYITAHTYFWAQDGVTVNKGNMKTLMDTFENKIYPKDREFFGSEWTPGVDGDPHIFIVYGGDIGSNIAGQFASPDEYNPAVRKYSNGHEMFVINTSEDLANDYTYATLAHEFVHMIQWPSDRNDVPWINEGFAEVGAFINGYDVGGADWIYSQSPDLQLNTWPDPSSPDFSAHYGQSFLYLTYFLDRFGEKATKALTADPGNDLTSVDDTLRSLNITDPQTGKLITADDVFMDWAAAMFLQDGSVGDGRYVYHNDPLVPQTSVGETIQTCPQSPQNYTVSQYGIDYIAINCAGQYALTFTGSTQVGLLPADAHSGSYAFWSNRGDLSDMTLTREFDLSGVGGPVEFSYWTWYDLEKDYDYLYLEASTDGQHWDLLHTPSCTDKDPSGNSFGCGYNAKSGGGNEAKWINEKVDLSQYAGKKIQLRFEYVTDEAVNGEGLLLDDASLAAVNYSSDFEADNGGWTANGFARVQNALPQTFRLELIVKGATTTVQNITVKDDQTAEVPLSLKSGQTAVLIVTGTQRFTRLPAAYTIEIK